MIQSSFYVFYNFEMDIPLMSLIFVLLILPKNEMIGINSTMIPQVELFLFLF